MGFQNAGTQLMNVLNLLSMCCSPIAKLLLKFTSYGLNGIIKHLIKILEILSPIFD